MGLINRKVKRTEQLHASGVRGVATVESVKLVNRGEFKISISPEDLVTGATSVTRVKLELRVELPGREPYTTKMRVQVPMMSFTKLAAETIVPVVVDPAKPNDIEIDWDGEVVEPTLEQRAQNDPMLQALLDRRIDPPTG